MYTQCPKCQTFFHVTLEQLQVRDGLVRCGQCNNAFQADQHLYNEIPQPQEKPAEEKKMEKRVATPAPKKSRSTATKAAPTSAVKAPAATERPARRAPRATKPARSIAGIEEVTAAPAPWAPPVESPAPPTPQKTTEKSRRDKPRPVAAVERVPFFERRRPRVPSFLWIALGLVLTFSLITQLAYFYRDVLADYPQLRPFIVDICTELGCVIHSRADVSRIELIQPTGIAPHPRTANALRLRATMVNRAPKPQPYPMMEVTLTDSAGRVLSRRTFAPNEYLEQSMTSAAEMLPNFAVSALLDVTNPDGKAVGYQIDFVASTIN